ncbi:hypothetical protein DLAC_05352 [Tieghemostelium lacteum]|uniref:Glutathione peroxidase n=1 Tax=Tieghemostelium lacteum TaxID=361077 RepID=A0A151ZFN0_TIELA|nr:hypothetical protein DLAC_05352 [Tieghemostelium lacteum]|eukprot:KYQ92773.1 hypothetical protein DLAC_05352 [Tieghemostelium lacteum]
MAKFADDGLVILGFPCGQFYNQEPGTNSEILDCLKYVRPGNGFEPNFLLFNKTIINGLGTDNTYIWLKSGCPNTSPVISFIDNTFLTWNPVQYNDITWNFEKFLVSRSGQLVRRYSPETFPLLLMNDIYDLLSE